MRALVSCIVTVLLVSMLSGCEGEDCTPCGPSPEQALAQFRKEFEFGSQGTADSVFVHLMYMTRATVLELNLQPEDEDSVFTIDAVNNPDFDLAAAIMTDGVDDLMEFWVFARPADFGTGIQRYESEFFEGGFTGDLSPDLTGAEITRIFLNVDRLRIENYTGYSMCELQLRVTIMGRL